MITSKNVSYLQHLIYDNTGVIIADNKLELITARLKPLATKANLSSVDVLLNLIQSQPSTKLRSQVIDALMTNETRFFREQQLFDLLKNRLIDLRVKTNSNDHTFNIWSAACSTGQEVYSIAITLAQSRHLMSNMTTSIYASDVCEPALTRAKLGCYSEFEMSRGLCPSNKVQYFTPSSSHQWQINTALRQSINFRSINLIRTLPNLPLMDVIFLRNVMIYFDDGHKIQVLQKIKNQLKSGGYLIVGTGETPNHYEPGFIQLSIDSCVVYQKR